MMFDHTDLPASHGRIRVNGVRLHYAPAGTGTALLLMHGTPKTHACWQSGVLECVSLGADFPKGADAAR
jgi:pimeloyl-ACP methyl ester carboxylesterase